MEEKYKIYNGDVCSIEDMQLLETNGFNIDDATCMWTSIQDKDYNPISWLPVFRGKDMISLKTLRYKFPLTYKEGNVFYCYTLNDLIQKLPSTINKDGNEYKMYIHIDKFNNISNVMYMNKEAILHKEISDSMTIIPAIINMLLWIKNNNE